VEKPELGSQLQTGEGVHTEALLSTKKTKKLQDGLICASAKKNGSFSPKQSLDQPKISEIERPLSARSGH
jgi:hypothetical protein